MNLDFTEAELHRYARHIILPEIGGTGQAKLRAARVLVVGAGGLGAPLLQYLAAAGVGTIGVIDHDTVSLSNLQRQVIHRTADVGVAKVTSAQRALAEINPEVHVVAHQVRLSPGNALALVADYDVIADGSDNFATRYLLTDACFLAKRTLVAAAILRFEGQLSTYKPHLGAPYPCYRCVFPEPPPPDAVPSCAAAGVLGAMAGTIGTWQATEVVKEILGIGESLAGKLLLYDALDARVERLTVARRADCPLCGTKPAITALDSPMAQASYAEAYCGD
ncbi:molybdopterin-synthase adenylyltransferase MoeB [Reyranella sp. CPCC 100927]|uniref:HesA/MoeB/ThiF family protein n=1 Tax=Reyranella sp. CPCC 100927 TaxID=2599616 RepID=UPI0011B44BAA|nr:molybdopterin-synthase adenylyltransferase MoeB [Reyranella sp. CPCC 100927]TWT00232.1 molybdopterin-synthase adenylyltransferase MoeB [Reyranella sp. CPCC 100927]